MITYSGDVIIYRATQFDRHEFRKIGITSGSNVNEEFNTSLDLSQPPFPNYPIAVVSPNVNIIKFVVIKVSGGTAVIRLINEGVAYNSIDIPVRGTMILEGVSLTQILVINHISPCFIEIFGSGTK